MIDSRKQFSVFNNSREGTCTAELVYSYTVGGGTYAGHWREEFGGEPEALEFTRDLEAKPVTVSYNPNNPADSLLLKDAIAVLLNARAPSNGKGGVLARATDVPSWIKPLLWPLIVVAAVGFGLSLWVHFGAVAGKKVAPEPLFWMLHIGIFVVWFPAVLVSNRRVGKSSRKDYWDVVFRDSPAWFKYAVYGFLGYAVVNFLIFISEVPNGEEFPGEGAPVAAWRGFSGHWMAFYAAALAILYSAVRSARESGIDPSGA
jgi:hypothetical protein